MTIEADLIAYLIDNVTDSATDFIRTTADPSITAPYVEIMLDDNDRTRQTTQTSVNLKTTLEFECWERTQAAADTLAAEISGLLEDLSETVGSTKIFRSRIFNEFDGADKTTKLFFRSFSVSFTHQPA